MNKEHECLPFGIFFEETASPPDFNRVPTYDSNSDISYIQNMNGDLVPYVDFGNSTETETYTLVRGEATDADNSDNSASPNHLIGTATVTETRQETTDADDPPSNYLQSLGLTATETRLRHEDTDSDVGYDLPRPSNLCVTATATKVRSETTDDD